MKYILFAVQVDEIVRFAGEGTYCFTIRANGFVNDTNQKCAKNDMKKFEILSSEFRQHWYGVCFHAGMEVQPGLYHQTLSSPMLIHLCADTSPRAAPDCRGTKMNATLNGKVTSLPQFYRPTGAPKNTNNVKVSGLLGCDHHSVDMHLSICSLYIDSMIPSCWMLHLQSWTQCLQRCACMQLC